MAANDRQLLLTDNGHSTAQNVDTITYRIKYTVSQKTAQL